MDSGESAAHFRVLCIDDEVNHLDTVKGYFTPEAIDAFVEQHPGALKPDDMHLLKNIELVAVQNNPGDAELRRALPKPDHLRRNDPEYAEFERSLTPLARATRDVYDGEYDLVISDFNMPGWDKKTNELTNKTGGYLLASAARLADVPFILNTTTPRATVRENIEDMGAFATGVVSARHERFSRELTVTGKDDQLQLYRAVVQKLEHAQARSQHVHSH